MPQKSGMFDSTIDDPREYAAREFAEYFARLITNGVFNGGQYLRVSATGTDAYVSISAGSAWINGYTYSVYDEAIALAITPATTLDRIDRIVLRLDTSTPARSIRARVIQGVPSANPTPPALTRSGDVWEISLAQVRVIADSIIVTQARITDERLIDAVCGLVNSLIRVDTYDFQLQWDAFLEDVQDQGFATTAYVNSRVDTAKTYVDAKPWQKHKLTDDAGVCIALTAGADLNTLLKNGQYTGANLLHSPTNGMLYVEVLAYGDVNFCMQRVSALEVAVPTMYTRVRFVGTWGPWSTDLFQSGVDAKNGAVASLNAKGVAATAADIWATINAKIRQISVKTYTAPTAVSGANTIANLAFTPKVLVVSFYVTVAGGTNASGNPITYSISGSVMVDSLTSGNRTVSVTPTGTGAMPGSVLVQLTNVVFGVNYVSFNIAGATSYNTATVYGD